MFIHPIITENCKQISGHQLEKCCDTYPVLIDAGENYMNLICSKCGRCLNFHDFADIRSAKIFVEAWNSKRNYGLELLKAYGIGKD